MISRPVEVASIRLICSLFVATLGAYAAQDPCLNLSVPVWTNNQLQLTFLGESGVTYFIESSADLQSWAPIATNSDSDMTRVVILDAPTDGSFYRASRTLLPMFVAGIAAKQGVSLNGVEVTADAYDS